jgi:hypothetical protein
MDARERIPTRSQESQRNEEWSPAREDVERLAHQYWEQRGGEDGFAEQDWSRAEAELRRRRQQAYSAPALSDAHAADEGAQRTVVGVFDSIDAAQRAYDELQVAGFSRDEISFVANKAQTSEWASAQRARGDAVDDVGSEIAADAGIGAALGGVGGLLLTFAGLVIPGVGPVVAAGPLIAALGGAGVGAAAGGLIGALTESGVPEERARHYAEGIRRGHVLITVRAGGDRASRASQTLERSGAIDIDDRVSAWRARGWTGFDPNAAPLSNEELRREREYYNAAREQEKEWDRMSRDREPGRLTEAEAENAEKDAARTTRAGERAISAGRRDVEKRDLASEAGTRRGGESKGSPPDRNQKGS